MARRRGLKQRIFLVLGGAAVFASAGCGAQLRSDFIPARDSTPAQQTGAAPLVGSPDQVKISYGLPDGLALDGNELTVQKGFDHKVRGYIKVVYDKGMCDSSKADKKTVVEKLQQAAYAQGANAVVLAYSALRDKPGFWDVCSAMDKGFGHGWAVVLAGAQ